MTTRRTNDRRPARGRRLAALAMGLISIGLAVPAASAQAPGAGEERTVQGTVQRLTTAPRGEVDGAVLDDGTMLHWPPHLADRFRAVADRGERVRAVGRTETGPAGDTHFEVARVRNLRTDALAENDGPMPPPPPGGGPRISADSQKAVEGAIRRFTTAPMGEVDGAVLDDGTTLHWPPHLADRFRSALDRGDRVRAVGRTETGPAGDTHFEVARVTNTRTGTAIVNDAPGAPVVRDFDRPAGRRERLRALEGQVEQLRREIERLRREPD